MAFYTKQEFLFHIDTTLMVEVSKELQFRLLEIQANAVMSLASGTGNLGWSRTRSKLVCCEATRLRSNYVTTAYVKTRFALL